MELPLYLRVVLVSFAMVNVNVGVSREIDQYLKFIADIQQFYKAGGVYVVQGDADENFTAVAALLNLLRRFSSRRISSQFLRLTDFTESYNGIQLFRTSRRDLIVIILRSEGDLENFEHMARLHPLTNQMWLILFWAKPTSALMKFCKEPSNRFNLKHDVLVLVKCRGDPLSKFKAVKPH